MKNKIKLSKKQIEQMNQVCHVLVPEYETIKTRSDGCVVFKCLKKGYFSDSIIKRRLGLNYVLTYVLPSRLSLFKYNNLHFLPEVQKDLISLQMDNKDIIEYYYNEILALKFPELIKEKEETYMEVPVSISFDEPDFTNGYEFDPKKVAYDKSTVSWLEEFRIEILIGLATIAVIIGFYAIFYLSLR